MGLELRDHVYGIEQVVRYSACDRDAVAGAAAKEARASRAGFPVARELAGVR